jgi:hypothetical protein
MPKLTPRERLTELESRQRAIAEEADAVRRSIRAHHGAAIADLALEHLIERTFRDLIIQAIRAGGSAALAALKALPDAASSPPDSPERRPGDEHGGAARRRPAAEKAAASTGDGAGR